MAAASRRAATPDRPPPFAFSLKIEGSSKGERVSLMETLSLREMIWLAHSSAWTPPSLGRQIGSNPWIVHAEHCSVVPDTVQWRERSAWSEEPIGAIPGLIRGAGPICPVPSPPIHAERHSVRIVVPHGRQPRILADTGLECRGCRRGWPPRRRPPARLGAPRTPRRALRRRAGRGRWSGVGPRRPRRPCGGGR